MNGYAELGLTGKGMIQYFRHPKTGVVVEVDAVGLVTFTDDEPGDFRSFDAMKQGIHSNKRIWSALDEIKVLTRHGWKLI